MRRRSYKIPLFWSSQLCHPRKKELQEAYSSIAFPGNSAALALQRYVSQHREADAFELSTQRSLDSFYVNIGVSCDDSILGRLLDGRLLSLQSGTKSIEETQFFALWYLSRLLPDSIDSEEWLDVGKSVRNVQTILSRAPVDSATVVVKRASCDTIRDSFSGYLELQQKEVAQSSEVKSQSKVISSTIDALKVADDLLLRMAKVFRWESVDREERVRATTMLFREIMPEALLDTAENILVSGQAGAGKTCLARMIAQSAMDQGLTCVYFPCSAITDAEQPLDDAVRCFLAQLAPDVTNDDFDHLIEQVDVIVVDGCDESASFSTRLAADIRSLATPLNVSVPITTEELSELRIPSDLRSTLVVEPLKRGTDRLAVRGPLSDSDVVRAIALNANTRAESPLQLLHESLRTKRRTIIATARNDTSLDLPESFARLTLSSFDNEQVEHFFRSWSNAADIAPEPVLSFLRSNQYIHEICRTPINATIVAAAYENGYDLPHSRVEVYHRRFELLLDRWDRVRRVLGRNSISKSDKYRFLSRLALSLHRRHARTFTRQNAKDIWDDGFQRIYPTCTIDDVLSELRHANSVITYQGANRYSLGHLSYQEYLAAYAIASGQYVEFIVQRLDDSWWHHVALFYAGIAGDISRFVAIMQNRTGIRDPGGLLSAMMDEARYTGDLMRSVIVQMLSEDYPDNGAFLEDETDLTKPTHSDESIEQLIQERGDTSDESSGLSNVGDHWERLIEIDPLGYGHLVVETDGRQISESQLDTMELLTNMDNLGEACVSAILGLCEADVASLCEEIRADETSPSTVFSDYNPKYSVRNLILRNIALKTITIPRQEEGDLDFDVYVDLSWNSDFVAVVQWQNGKIIDTALM